MELKEQRISLETRKAELEQFLGSKKNLTSSTPQELATKRSELDDVKVELKRVKKKLSEPVFDPICNNTKKLITDPSKWLESFIKKHSVKVSPRGIIFDSNLLMHSDFEAEYKLGYDESYREFDDVSNVSASRISPDLLRSAVQKWYRIQKELQLELMYESIKFDSNATDHALRRWIFLMTGSVTDMHVAIMKHWIQQTKRKIRGLKVDYHIFPIFFGGQENGKSKGIERLLSPLSDWTLHLEVNQIVDTTIMGCFQDNAVVFCDEMVKGEKTAMDAIKRTITSDTLSARPPYAARIETIRQNCSFIGASNKTVDYLFKDDEMRRFVQIDTIARDSSQYQEMDNLDVLSIWRCVGEDNPNEYYKAESISIKKAQAVLCTPEPIKIWAQEHNVYRHAHNTEFRDSRTLYESYRDWIVKSGYQWSGSIQDFGKKLRSVVNLETADNRITIDGKKLTFYLVPSDCIVAAGNNQPLVPIKISQA